MLSATQILAVPESQPERLFSAPDQVGAEFKALAKRWHPDVRGGDNKVFQHITVLHRVAVERADKGQWIIPGRLDLKGADGIEYHIHHVRDFDFGLGRAYLNESIVAYVFPKDVAHVAREAEESIRSIRFPAKTAELQKKLRDEFTPRIPAIRKRFVTDDGRAVLVLTKPNDAIRLRDLLDHEKGFLDPRHTAWIMSELLNICCWLKVEGMTHNDLSLDSVFIRPEQHHVWLSGWWYAVPEGQRMRSLQSGRTVRHLPASVINTKKASFFTDLNQVRLLGRELFGDELGMRLGSDTRVPEPFRTWLRHASSGVGKTDFAQWHETAKASFGARRFTKMAISFSDVYRKET